MIELNAEGQETEMLMARAAWLYYIAGLNQEAAAKRLGITRARINRLLADARETGLVSIQINDANVGLLPVEEALRARYGLDLCICTPALGAGETAAGPARLQEVEALMLGYAFRAVGMAAALHLKRHVQENRDAVVGTGWGRTLEQMTLNLAGIAAPEARFISLMGSLTANSAYNPFEVVHAFARATGGEGHVLPVPFIADSPDDRQVLMSQRSVQQGLTLARQASVAYISIGELTEGSLLRRQGMISAEDLASSAPPARSATPTACSSTPRGRPSTMSSTGGPSPSDSMISRGSGPSPWSRVSRKAKPRMPSCGAACAGAWSSTGTPPSA